MFVYFEKIKHIKKIFFTILLVLISSCKAQHVTKTHGISYLEEREKILKINKSNKNDIVKNLGQPSTKGMTDNNIWIYIETNKSRGKLLKLGKSYTKKNNVLVLEFNKFGLLAKKELYTKDEMNKVDFAKTITENDIKKENFIYSFLSSIRQKMEQGRK